MKETKPILVHVDDAGSLNMDIAATMLMAIGADGVVIVEQAKQLPNPAFQPEPITIYEMAPKYKEPILYVENKNYINGLKKLPKRNKKR